MSTLRHILRVVTPSWAYIRSATQRLPVISLEFKPRYKLRETKEIRTTRIGPILRSTSQAPPSSATMTDPNPFLLAANGPGLDPRLLSHLRENPSLASNQDSYGYSLLHAAASYNHIDLLRALVNEFHVNVNLRDEDNETCLFVAETVEAAKCLVEELKVDTSLTNDDGQTAREKIESEDDYPEVAAYLAHGSAAVGQLSQNANASGHPPPLPPNVKVNIGTVAEDAGGQEPDPEFKRRIEELAGSENFHTEEGQQELRALITDAVMGVSQDEQQQDSQRRRIG